MMEKFSFIYFILYFKIYTPFRIIFLKNYFLTKEQMEEAYGDKSYLSNVQFERVISSIILDEFQYKKISLINVCKEPMRIYGDIALKSQIKISLD